MSTILDALRKVQREQEATAVREGLREPVAQELPIQRTAAGRRRPRRPPLLLALITVGAGLWWWSRLDAPTAESPLGPVAVGPRDSQGIAASKAEAGAPAGPGAELLAGPAPKIRAVSVPEAAPVETAEEGIRPVSIPSRPDSDPAPVAPDPTLSADSQGLPDALPDVPRPGAAALGVDPAPADLPRAEVSPPEATPPTAVASNRADPAAADSTRPAAPDARGMRAEVAEPGGRAASAEPVEPAAPSESDRPVDSVGAMSAPEPAPEMRAGGTGTRAIESASAPPAAAAIVDSPGAPTGLMAVPPRFPPVEIQSIRWHPNPVRRKAWLIVATRKLPPVHEGDIVSGVRIAEIRPDQVKLALGSMERVVELGP